MAIWKQRFSLICTARVTGKHLLAKGIKGHAVHCLETVLGPASASDMVFPSYPHANGAFPCLWFDQSTSRPCLGNPPDRGFPAVRE